MEQLFYTSWTSIGRTILIVMLRVSGKRTLSKMSAFDFVVTVALGSTLATVLLTKSVALADGLLAFGLLIGLQFIITWLSVRSARISQLVKSAPALLVYQGQYVRPTMQAERITEGEVLTALREHSVATLAEAAAVVLESDGILTVLSNTTRGPGSALGNVSGVPAS